MESIPWVEKYRPTNLEDVVLDSTNKKILNNIIKKNYFPNLLFYGPPGTGKTTTIINLIDKYQTTYEQRRKELKIHLNASDDRGIDIIRNQINQFVNTQTLFNKGMKFVILDEVDYMTKNAQQALRYLIQQYSENIRFCLICNYISRIDIALQHEFVRLRFCQLPQKSIYKFLNVIQEKEHLIISKEHLQSIQLLFKSDIRSMINFLQANHNLYIDVNTKKYILTDAIWEINIKKIKNTKNLKRLIKTMKQFSKDYNCDNKEFIILFTTYLLTNKEYALKQKWLRFFKFVIHNLECKEDYLVNYFLSHLGELLSSL